MYTRFSRQFYRAYLSSSHSRRNRYVSLLSTNCLSQRFLEITFNHSSASNLTRALYSSSIFYRKTDNIALCENGMELEINYEQLLDAQKDANVLIVDVREPSEISETGVLPGSIHIPMDDVRNVLENFSEEEFQKKYGKPKPAKDTKMIFSCRSGRRSANVQKTVQKLGYTQAYNYTGGWLNWQEESEKRKEGKEK